ncbi:MULTISPECIES: AzlC family ABC transporter permease [unclassified Polynucleobacter]|jgi:predicted branched-subunit amino acid permease|uniref:AzlC family ABC transporter permease n=1 Tax=unclassified Polynucleobacter TaxID=2640945 RepID=UPI0008CE38EC|nr:MULTISPECIES: AzlC family ABC transporter permease [unclassified Polynucleobacter]OHC09808.1 MAG: AzlC family protein [Polynucleobacter sp. GWA2_45_21]HBK43372.1 branched-chain amino acid ABC transporter permease [Polynucleobacter sp.]
MSLADKPYIDPSEIALEGSGVQRFKDSSHAFWSGIRDAAGAPAMVLFAGMVGFGAMGKTNGMDVWFTSATSFLMFALPGQVVLLEMAITGSSVLAIALAVTLTSTRFITMTVTLFPQFHEKDRNHGLYASVHLLAMTAWAISMREFQTIEAKHRLSYFIGLGLLCWLISVPGTILGYYLAGMVPPAITLGLVFINPLFFLLTFTEVKVWINRIAIGLGFVLGPFFFILDRDTSLLTTGLVAGTAAYLFDRKVLRKKAGVIG